MKRNSTYMQNASVFFCFIMIAFSLCFALMGCNLACMMGAENQNDKYSTLTDYSDPVNWFVNDFNNEQKSDTKADVICIVGTIARDKTQDNGVAHMDNQMKQAISAKDTSVMNPINDGFEVFNDGTRMFIPYYRQIALQPIVDGCLHHDDMPNMIKNSEALIDLNAFLDYYFENYNQGRPFILAGFSQGAACVQIALEDYFGQSDHKVLLDRMVAAYSIGFGVDKNWLNKYNYLKFAQGANDTGVILSWNTEGPGEKDTNFLLADNPADTLEINPINWKTDTTYANGLECTGSYVDGEIVQPGIYDLQLDPQRGSLICNNNEKYANYKGKNLFGGKSLHDFEFSEAYLSIRQNMHDRINAFLQKQIR